MKIELKKELLTWELFRYRYLLLKNAEGITGLMMLAAYNFNVKLLEQLYNASNFENQCPPSDEFLKYKAEEEKLLIEYATVDGKVKTKIVDIDEKKMKVLDIDQTDPAVIQINDYLQLTYGQAIEERKKQYSDWENLLKKEVPIEIQQMFWKAPFNEAPKDNQISYLAVEWFLKDVPDLSK